MYKQSLRAISSRLGQLRGTASTRYAENKPDRIVSQRCATAFLIAQLLKRYAEQLHLAVLIINQVGQADQQHVPGDPLAVKAALGMSWHHCVSTRILIEHQVDQYQRDDSTFEGDNRFSDNRRSLSVVKSSYMPEQSLSFQITPLGIVEHR